MITSNNLNEKKIKHFFLLRKSDFGIFDSSALSIQNTIVSFENVNFWPKIEYIEFFIHPLKT